jgi:hypothetical protein
MYAMASVKAYFACRTCKTIAEIRNALEQEIQFAFMSAACAAASVYFVFNYFRAVCGFVTLH